MPPSKTEGAAAEGQKRVLEHHVCFGSGHPPHSNTDSRYQDICDTAGLSPSLSSKCLYVFITKLCVLPRLLKSSRNPFNCSTTHTITRCCRFQQDHVLCETVLFGWGNRFLTRWSTHLKVKTKTLWGTHFRYVPVDFRYQMEKHASHLTCIRTNRSFTSQLCLRPGTEPTSIHFSATV